MSQKHKSVLLCNLFHHFLWVCKGESNLFGCDGSFFKPVSLFFFFFNSLLPVKSPSDAFAFKLLGCFSSIHPCSSLAFGKSPSDTKKFPKNILWEKSKVKKKCSSGLSQLTEEHLICGAAGNNFSTETILKSKLTINTLSWPGRC